jgi:hypothetical protein
MLVAARAGYVAIDAGGAWLGLAHRIKFGGATEKNVLFFSSPARSSIFVALDKTFLYHFFSVLIFDILSRSDVIKSTEFFSWFAKTKKYSIMKRR